MLLKFSTGEPHPSARHSRLFVANSEWARPAINMEISGDNLALIVTHFLPNHLPQDRFYVYEWKTGVLKMVSPVIKVLRYTCRRPILQRKSLLQVAVMGDWCFSRPKFYSCQTPQKTSLNFGTCLQLLRLHQLAQLAPWVSLLSKRATSSACFRVEANPILSQAVYHIQQGLTTPLRWTLS